MLVIRLPGLPYSPQSTAAAVVLLLKAFLTREGGEAINGCDFTLVGSTLISSILGDARVEACFINEMTRAIVFS
jgi:hypothetical protein